MNEIEILNCQKVSKVHFPFCRFILNTFCVAKQTHKQIPKYILICRLLTFYANLKSLLEKLFSTYFLTVLYFNEIEDAVFFI